MDSGFERHFSELVARERSGHTAVAEDNLLYVWGGYMVRKTNTHDQILRREFPVCRRPVIAWNTETAMSGESVEML